MRGGKGGRGGRREWKQPDIDPQRNFAKRSVPRAARSRSPTRSQVDIRSIGIVQFVAVFNAIDAIPLPPILTYFLHPVLSSLLFLYYFSIIFHASVRRIPTRNLI